MTERPVTGNTMSTDPVERAATQNVFVQEGQAFLKVLVLGNVRLEKMTPLQSYVQNIPSSRFKLGLNSEFSIKDFKTPSESPVYMELWDATEKPEQAADGLSASERAVELSHSADVTILLFEMQDPLSFKAVQGWHELFMQTACPRNAETFPFILVGVDSSGVRKTGLDNRKYAADDPTSKAQDDPTMRWVNKGAKPKPVKTQVELEVDPAVRAAWELNQFRGKVRDWCKSNYNIPFHEAPKPTLQELNGYLYNIATQFFSKENEFLMVHRKPNGFWHVPDRNRDLNQEMKAVALPGTNLVTRVDRDPAKVMQLESRFNRNPQGGGSDSVATMAKPDQQRYIDVDMHKQPYVRI